MRIVVNDIAASSGGAMSILKQFYNYICENDTENEWIFLLSDSYLEETDNIKIKVVSSVKKSGLHKLWFDFISGSKFINSLKADVVLSMQNIITFGVKAPQYVYIHQSIPFQTAKNFSLFKGLERSAAIYQHIIGRIIKFSVKKSDGIIVQTNWMKNAVQKCVKKDKKFCVALPDVPKFDVDFSKIKNENTFFYPTSPEIYKNIAVIEEAVKLLDNKDFKVILTVEKDLIKSEKIDCVGRLNSEQMADMYSKAVLLFPSYIETVGLPLLEAMQFGSVIFAADCDYSREILENYPGAYFFNAWNPNKLADLMSRYLSGDILRKTDDMISVDNVSNWKSVIDYIIQ